MKNNADVFWTYLRSYFSVYLPKQRKTIGNVLYTIDSSEGKPILPAFGYVGMAALLPNLENFKTKEDVLRTAIK